MDPAEVVRSSATYRWARTLGRWARHSRAVRLVASERFQLGVLAVVLLGSLVGVSRSSMEPAVKFLSFVVLFLLAAALTWPLTDPRGAGGADP